MNREQLFSQPDFIPVFNDYAGFANSCIGLTGHRGVLGSILHKRFSVNGIRTLPFEGDITDTEDLRTWLAQHQFTHFFHFAAMVPVGEVDDNPLHALETNVIGTFNICKYLHLTQTHSLWLFLASSSHVYLPTQETVSIAETAPVQPSTYYGETKSLSEKMASALFQKLSRSICIGRIFSFTHNKQREPYLVPTLLRKITALDNGSELNVINPNSVRDIMDAETVIDCVQHLATYQQTGTVNIGSGTAKTIAAIARELAHLKGIHISITGEDRTPPNSLIADVTRLRELLREA